MTKDAAKKPKGRTPVGAVLVDGQWKRTPEGIAWAAQRIVDAREKRRLKYREERETIRQCHPELFKGQTLLRSNAQQHDVSTSKSDSNPREAVEVPPNLVGTLAQWRMH